MGNVARIGELGLVLIGASLLAEEPFGVATVPTAQDNALAMMWRDLQPALRRLLRVAPIPPAALRFIDSGWREPAAPRIFVRHPKKTFATISWDKRTSVKWVGWSAFGTKLPIRDVCCPVATDLIGPTPHYDGCHAAAGRQASGKYRRLCERMADDLLSLRSRIFALISSFMCRLHDQLTHLNFQFVRQCAKAGTLFFLSGRNSPRGRSGCCIAR